MSKQYHFKATTRQPVEGRERERAHPKDCYAQVVVIVVMNDVVITVDAIGGGVIIKNDGAFLCLDFCRSLHADHFSRHGRIPKS